MFVVMSAVLSCDQQVVIELVGRGGDVDEQAIQNEMDTSLRKNSTVSVRQARFDADEEVVVRTSDSIILEEDINTIERVVRNQIIQQNIGFEVSEWRVEAV